MSDFDSWTGDGAPPRSNGELVFDAPWQSRAFGVAAALVEAGRFNWSDFRSELIVQIAASEAAGEEFEYYGCWYGALEALVHRHGLADAHAVEGRARQYAQRSPGHDH
ncbi:MAG: nitrile hydratase accessory protein [Acidimicrobiales bacterium]